MSSVVMEVPDEYSITLIYVIPYQMIVPMRTEYIQGLFLPKFRYTWPRPFQVWRNPGFFTSICKRYCNTSKSHIYRQQYIERGRHIG